MNYLCIDLGGTKTLVCIIDADGKMLTEVRFETPEHYPDFLDRLVHEIKQLPEAFTTGVMAIPGLIDQEHGVVTALGNRPWTHFSIKGDVQQRTGVELRLLNDARLAGLGEASYFKNQYSRLLYITISTGIGCALAVDGKLIHELDDTEVGHMPLMFEGKLTAWESFGSGHAIVSKYGKRASDIDDPAIWKDISRNFVAGIAPLCAVFQPDVIVFGGGVGKQSEKFAHFIQEELDTLLHPVIRRPQALLACHYGDESVVYGCLELGKQRAA